MEKINQRKMEREFQKGLVIEFLRDFCVEKEISITKLKNERFILSCNECVFAHPSDIEPNGLLNDKETLPKPTLVVKYENEKFIIEQTEYTKKFLSEE